MQAKPPEMDRSETGPDFSGSGEFFRLAVESARVPVLVTDPTRPSNPVVYANRAFTNLTGYTSEETLGRNCRFLQGPETDPTAVASIRQAIAEQRDVCVELINYRKDGTPFWNSLSISPVFNQAHELTHFFAWQTDVTRRRIAEDKLKQAQRMDTLGELTGGIAHDFNNLLQVMAGYLDIIERTATKPTVDRQRLVRSAGHAKAAADRATMLTRQLLAFSRKQRLQAETLSINEVITSAHRSGAQALDHICVQTNLANDLWNCHIDPTQTKIALLNLFSNSRDALDGRPEPTIRIETRNVVIQGPSGLPAWAGLLPGRYVSVAICDNGVGIPEAVRDRVMDPFFSTKDEGRGTGLGLSTVYGFVLQSGGTVRVNSRENIGTTVRLYFPATPGEEKSSSAPTPSAAADGRAARGNEAILIVEDRHDVAELAYSVLTEYGYQPQIAHSGDEAWRRLTAGERYDLIFSDMIMPGRVNGVELARRIKQDSPETPILLTTGFSDSASERTSPRGSEYPVLAKPYGSSELVHRIRALLDHQASPSKYG